MNAFALLPAVLAASAFGADVSTFPIPRIENSFSVDGQRITAAASGIVAPAGKDSFDVKLDVELSDLQAHLTEILKAELDRDDRCGERLAIQHATLDPVNPGAVLTAQLHYERWACAKAFGKQVVKRLVGGNGTIQVALTLSVEPPDSLRVDAKVTSIQADGSLGEVLRSGSMGAMVREKIEASIRNAVRKAADLQSALPPAIKQVVSLRSVAFTGGPQGNLVLAVSGEVHLAPEQVKSAMGQVKGR